MNTKIMKKAWLSLLLIIGLGFVGCGIPGMDSGKVDVVTTIFPLQSIIENLGGEFVNVDSIVEPGMSPHNFEPAPSDVVKLTNADLVVLVGGNFDAWLKKLALDSGVDETKIIELRDYVTLRGVVADEVVENAESVDLAEGSENGSEEVAAETTEVGTEVGPENFDPHFWLSPKRVMELADDLTAKLVELDPEHASSYDFYYGDFDLELKSLDKYIEDEVLTFNFKKLITFHDSFGYLADDYGLEVVGVIEDIAGVEPTPEGLQRISDVIRENGVTVIYIEPQLNSAVVDALQQDLKVKVAELDPIGGTQSLLTWQAVVRNNVVVMRSNMK